MALNLAPRRVVADLRRQTRRRRGRRLDYNGMQKLEDSRSTPPGLLPKSAVAFHAAFTTLSMLHRQTLCRLNCFDSFGIIITGKIQLKQRFVSLVLPCMKYLKLA
jgi:hypothetical protein